MENAVEDIIDIRNLVKKYENKVAVDGISFTVKKGELFGFLGPNGAGKTTTVRCISTLTGIDDGTILIGGYDISKEAKKAKSLMGVIQQQISLDKDLTVRDNMNVHGMYHMLNKKERAEKIKELTDYFGLEDYLDMQVDKLSGGWKKRVAIVCAMLHSPAILFLDEPTSGLDINARRLLWDVVRKLNKSGTTVFLTTHYIEEAEALCDRVGIINKGKIIALDTPMALCSKVGTMTVEYMEGDRTQYKYFPNRQSAKDYVSTLDDDNVHIRKTNLEDVFIELTGMGGEVLK